MHTEEALEDGERHGRLHALPVWREAPVFTARERAALALTEAMTRLPEGGVPDAVYDAAAAELSEPELAALIWLVVTINAWNRVGVTTQLPPEGSGFAR